jgi:PBP1b-binding outer membrane lipoprotein LpoB
MRRAVLLVAVVLVGCGGGSPPVHEDVKAATKRLHERVKTSATKDPVDQALLQIEQSDMPADIKQQLLEAKALLDKYDGK